MGSEGVYVFEVALICVRYFFEIFGYVGEEKKDI